MERAMTVFLLPSLNQTKRFGEFLGSLCQAGDVICLAGDLGAGKTALTQSIARGLGVNDDEYVSSPTFSVFHQYSGRLELYHMDFYRLNSSDDVLSMGLDEYFYLEGVTVIEWCRKAADIIPEKHLLIELQAISSEQRKIRCTGTSKSWKKRIETLVEKLDLQCIS